MKETHRAEIAVYCCTPITFVAGIVAVVFLATPYALFPGSALAMLSLVAFCAVHCIRVNRHRRERRQPPEVC